MPKLQLSATELVEPDVDIVAMVKRGANRIPFRLTKKDGEDMIDLSKIGAALFSKSAAIKAPTVVGVIFAKGADIEALTATLKTHGIDLAQGFTKAEAAATTTFTKADAEVTEENVLVLKLDDQVALTIAGPADVMKGVALYDWESTSFKDIMKKGTFVPSLMMAQDMLSSTFFNIMEKAENPDQLASLMTKAADEFGAYVGKLVKALPESVFKAETDLTKMSHGKKSKSKDKGLADEMDDDDKMKKGDDPCWEGYVQVGTKKKDGKTVPNCVPKEDAVQKADGTYILKSEAFQAPDGTYLSKEDIANAPVNGSKTSDTEVPKDGVVSNNIDGEPAEGNGTPKNPPTKSNGPGGAVSNDVEGNPAADDAKTSQPTKKGDEEDPVMAMLKSMQATMEKGLKDVRDHVDQSVSTVKEEVSGLTKKVAKAEAALEGTVVGDAEGDQTGQLTKSDRISSAPPLLDTAITPISKLEREMKGKAA